jgi:hypothetical protein
MFLLVQLVMSSLCRLFSLSLINALKWIKKVKLPAGPPPFIRVFFCRIVSPTIVLACLSPPTRKSLTFQRRKRVAHDCVMRILCFSRCPGHPGYDACHEGEKNGGPLPSSHPSAGLDAWRPGLYESRNTQIPGCSANSGHRHASRIEPILCSSFPIPRCRGGRKPLDHKHLPLNSVSCPRNSGLLNCFRVHEVITKKTSEIKSFLLVWAQFPVPVLGMFRTGGRCQSGPPFPLTGDFRIPKLNPHCLRLRDRGIENSSGRRM